MIDIIEVFVKRGHVTLYSNCVSNHDEDFKICYNKQRSIFLTLDMVWEERCIFQAWKSSRIDVVPSRD